MTGANQHPEAADKLVQIDGQRTGRSANIGSNFTDTI